MSPTELCIGVSRRASRANWLIFLISSLPLANPHLAGCTTRGGREAETSARAARLTVGDGGAVLDAGDVSSTEQTPPEPDPVGLAPDELHELTREILASESGSGWENLSETGLDQVNQLWSKNPPTDKHQSALSLKDEDSLQLTHENELQMNEAYEKYATILAEESLNPDERGKLKALLIEDKAEGTPKEQVQP